MAPTFDDDTSTKTRVRPTFGDLLRVLGQILFGGEKTPGQPPTQPPIDELSTLIELVDRIERLLDRIVHDPTLFRAEVRHLLPGPWEEIKSLFEKGRQALRKTDWGYIEGVGLTRSGLWWKRDLLETDAKHGKLGAIVHRIDSLLGSLAKVIPVFEPILEYKEQVEASIEDLNRSIT